MKKNINEGYFSKPSGVPKHERIIDFDIDKMFAELNNDMYKSDGADACNNIINMYVLKHEDEIKDIVQIQLKGYAQSNWVWFVFGDCQDVVSGILEDFNQAQREKIGETPMLYGYEDADMYDICNIPYDWFEQRVMTIMDKTIQEKIFLYISKDDLIQEIKYIADNQPDNYYFSVTYKNGVIKYYNERECRDYEFNIGDGYSVTWAENINEGFFGKPAHSAVNKIVNIKRIPDQFFIDEIAQHGRMSGETQTLYVKTKLLEPFEQNRNYIWPSPYRAGNGFRNGTPIIQAIRPKKIKPGMFDNIVQGTFYWNIPVEETFGFPDMYTSCPLLPMIKREASDSYNIIMDISRTPGMREAMCLHGYTYLYILTMNEQSFCVYDVAKDILHVEYDRSIFDFVPYKYDVEACAKSIRDNFKQYASEHTEICAYWNKEDTIPDIDVNNIWLFALYEDAVDQFLKIN